MPRRSSVGGLFAPIGGLGRDPWNKATGGTEATITNYNGTGQTWKTHTFTGASSLVVTKNPLPFSVLMVAGGGCGGTGTPNGSGGGGGGGGVWNTTSATLAVTTHSVTIGAGGPPDNGDYYPSGANYGGDTALGSLTCGGGGTGGTGHWEGKKPEGGGSGGRSGTQANGSAGGAGSADNNPSAGGGGDTVSTISGTSTHYGVGGTYAAGGGPQGVTDANPGAGGGGYMPVGSPASQGGRDGIVIVAYQIG